MRKLMVILGMFGILCFASTARAETPDWAKSLFQWVNDNNVGVTYTHDISEYKDGMGAKINPIKLFNGYASAGLFAYLNEPSLGGNISVDVVKLLNKGKAESTVLLKNFDIGYWFTWTSVDNFFKGPFNPDLDGVLGTVVKIQF